eukprot:210276-Pelagomonas_calceolata.AAC.3
MHRPSSPRARQPPPPPPLARTFPYFSSGCCFTSTSSNMPESIGEIRTLLVHATSMTAAMATWLPPALGIEQVSNAVEGGERRVIQATWFGAQMECSDLLV